MARKRKRTNQERREAARREVEADPIGRELRRHIEKIEAELGVKKSGG